jgi:hypothetical protein
MSKYTITPTAYDSQIPSIDPIMNGRIYLCIQIDSGHPDIPCQISGWVRPEVAALVKAAPELLDALIRLLGSTHAGNADEHESGCGCVIHEARAAIAKAS